MSWAAITASPAGSTTQIQYNNAGAFAGSANLTFDGNNVGIGTSPAAMFSSARALQLGVGTILEGRSAGGTVSTLSSNQYINTSSARTYITSDFASYYGQINGQHQFYTAPSGTAGTTATFTQVLALNKDQTVALQGASLSNGTGITFPATQSASTDANTLDDYEEGTWTPSLGGTTTYTAQAGSYVKIGRLVYIFAYLNINVIGTGSTTVVSGLPFNPVNSSSRNASGMINYFNGLATSVVSVFCQPINASNQVNFPGLTAAAASVVNPITMFTSGTQLYFSAVYETTA